MSSLCGVEEFAPVGDSKGRGTGVRATKTTPRRGKHEACPARQGREELRAATAGRATQLERSAREEVTI